MSNTVSTELPAGPAAGDIVDSTSDRDLAAAKPISVLKGTALVSVIAMTDLLHSVQVIYNQTYQIVPLLIVACIWYLVVVTLLSVAQGRLERRFARGYAQQSPTQRRGPVPAPQTAGAEL